ncbi:Fc.00g001590.m01.CDS01 [Cosmosporella sp. VM-42]
MDLGGARQTQHLSRDLARDDVQTTPKDLSWWKSEVAQLEAQKEHHEKQLAQAHERLEFIEKNKTNAEWFRMCSDAFEKDKQDAITHRKNLTAIDSIFEFLSNASQKPPPAPAQEAGTIDNESDNDSRRSSLSSSTITSLRIRTDRQQKQPQPPQQSSTVMDEENPEVLKSLETEFNQAFPPTDTGTLSEDRILAGVPIKFMKIDEFEKSAHWRVGWRTMGQVLQEMSPSQRKRSYNCWYGGPFEAHPCQLINVNYMPKDDSAGLLTVDVLKKVTTCLCALKAVKNSGKMTLEPIYFFLWFVQQQCEILEKRGKIVSARSLLMAMGHKQNLAYYNPVFAAVFEAGKTLQNRGGQPQRNVAAGQKRARSEQAMTDGESSINVRPRLYD